MRLFQFGVETELNWFTTMSREYVNSIEVLVAERPNEKPKWWSAGEVSGRMEIEVNGEPYY